MQDSRKTKITGAVLLVSIIFVAILLIASLNSLAWPIGSDVSKVANLASVQQRVAYGVLSVFVYTNRTLLVTPSSDSEFSNQVNTKLLPMGGLPITVSYSDHVAPLLSNLTDRAGHVVEYLPPNNYAVRVLDWRFGNVTIFARVTSNNVTDLKITLNATAFVVDKFDVEDPDSSGFVVGWNTIFAHLTTSQVLHTQGSNSETFLDVSVPAPILLINADRSLVIPASLTPSSSDNNSQWIQLKITGPLRIQNIKTMNLLTLSVFSVITTAAQ